MFDIGFTELMIIGVVGLVVIGPERLPRVARTVGHLLGRLQRYVGDVKSDIQREMQLEDLKKLQQEVAEQARDLENNIRNQANDLKQGMDKTAGELNDTVNELTTDAAGEKKVPEAAQPDAAAMADAERQIQDAVAEGDNKAPAADDSQMALGLDTGPGATNQEKKA